MQSPCKRQNTIATKLPHLRDFALIPAKRCKKQVFCFLEQGEASKSILLQYNESVKITLHTKTEKKMLTKMWNQNYSRPRQRRQKFDRDETSTFKIMFYEINEKRVCANVLSILSL